jgi:hypothetical protein
VTVAGAVEGLVDEAVLKRLIEHVGAVPGPVHGRRGKDHLRSRVGGYNQASRFGRWLVLVDLDGDADCAPPFVRDWLPQPAPGMCLRVAVRKVEAWLLADRDRLARFLGVKTATVPVGPEALSDPKGKMVELARWSRRREIREDMVPRRGSGRAVGPAYTSRMIEFVLDPDRGWRPSVAAISADSLARCIRCLRQLAAAGLPGEFTRWRRRP